MILILVMSKAPYSCDVLILAEGIRFLERIFSRQVNALPNPLTVFDPDVPLIEWFHRISSLLYRKALFI